MNRKLLTIVLLLGIAINAVGVHSDKRMIVLNAWIEAHNSGLSSSFEQFIEGNYSAKLREKIDLADHVEFYKVLYDGFGKINPSIYKIIEDKGEKLVVHFVKEGIPIVKKDVNPEDVLVVELVFENGKLKRGLGLGSLLCYMKKK